MADIAQAYVQIIPTTQGIGSALENALGSAGESAGAKAGDKIEKSVSSKLTSAGSKITGVGKAMTVLTGVIAAAGIASVSAASSFESSFAQLATIADTNEVSADKLQSDIMAVSNKYGIAAADIAEATYSAISAGRDTGDAVSFVGTAVETAKAGFTDTATAVDTLTTIMNAYGDSAGTAEQISDKLLTTQNKGKTTFGELGASIGKVIPTAAMYGVSLDQLAAAYVTTTKNGIATAESTTYINGMLNELGKSGSIASETLKDKMGMSFQELMENGYSLSDVLGILESAAEESGQSLADMFGSQEAAKAAATITQHAEDFEDAIDAMGNSAGTTSAAFETMDSTTESSLDKMKTALQNAGIAIGSTLSPVISKLADAVAKCAEKFQNLPGPVKTVILIAALVIAAIGPLLVMIGSVVGAIGTLAAANTALNISLLPIIAIIAAVIAAIAAVIIVIKNWGAISAWLAGTWESIKAKCSEVFETIKDKISDVWDSIKTTTTNIWNGITGTISTAWNNIKTGVSTAVENVKTTISNVWNSIKTTAANIWGSIVTTISTAWNNIKAGVTAAVEAVKTTISNVWNSIKSTTSDIWNGITGTISGAWNNITSGVSAAVNTVKDKVTSGFNGVSSTVSSIWSNIKSAITTPINAARDAVKNAIDRIKSIMHFSWSLPPLKLPHISISGSFSLRPPSAPHFSISWYEKAMQQPFMFGNATLFGAGEAGDEIMYGRANLMADIREATGGGSPTYNVNLNVYGAPGQNIDDLADEIQRRINRAVRQKQGVFA